MDRMIHADEKEKKKIENICKIQIDTKIKSHFPSMHHTIPYKTSNIAISPQHSRLSQSKQPSKKEPTHNSRDFRSILILDT